MQRFIEDKHNMDVIVTQDTAKVNESSVVEIKQVICYAAICGV